MRKRILALLLAIAMLLTMLPTAVFADEEITAEGESAAEAAEISPQAEETPEESVPVQESPAQELPAEQETPAQDAASDAAPEEKQETGEPEEPEEPEETEEAQITAEALDARENEYPWEEMDDSAFAQWVCSGEQDAYILEIWQEQGAAYASFSARVEAMEAAEAKEQVEHYVLTLTGEEAADGEPEEQTMDIPLDFGAPISADESLWYYVYWKAGMMYIPSLMSSKDQLTQAEQAIYDALEKQIVAVAEKGGSTKFTLEKAVLPAADVDQLLRQIGNIVEALMNDHPYELYWYDKVLGSSFSYGPAADGYQVNSLTFTVARDFQNGACTTEVTGDVAKIDDAIDYAISVVEDYAGYTNYEKLLNYNNRICAMTDYNNTAASNSKTPYGNPWQLIYVFDQDPATKVVCEGYSKAMKFLCDRTDWGDDFVECRLASGDMGTTPDRDEAGGHMWNIVEIEGKNYLLDATNSDSAIGSTGRLFLKGVTTDGNWMKADSLYYWYDDSMFALFSSEEVTISATDYEPPVSKDIASGTCGVGLTWKLNDENLLTISGMGKMDSYADTSSPWAEYAEDIVNVRVEYGVTGIGDRAFLNCGNLKSIAISGTVREIGWGAFSGCSSLTGISIPAGVTAIGKQTFQGCTGLTNVEIPKGVEAIGEYAFSGCTGLETVRIPMGITVLESNVFSGCTKLADAAIPFGVETIGPRAFYGCTGLTEAILPESVVCVEQSAFENCSGLLQVTIPGGAAEIGENAFNGCTGLTEVYFGGNSLEWNTIRMGAGNDRLKAVTIHYGREEPSSACGENLTWTFADGTLTISGMGEMYNYTSPANVPWSSRSGNITRVEILSGVTGIGDGAFRNCSNLESVTIPFGVTAIGAGAFSGCGSLSEVVIPNGVTAVDRRAFENCTALTAVTLPASVTTIGTYAFSGCENLAAIEIPQGVTALDYNTFAGCSSLSEVVIPENVTSIGRCAFENCSGLTALTIPASVTAIGPDAFSGCTGLTDINYAGNREEWSAIQIDTGNSNLKTDKIHFGKGDVCGENVTWMLDGGVLTISGTGAMADYVQNQPAPWLGKQIDSIVVESGVTHIGNYAFVDRPDTTSVTLADTVETIGERAFYRASAFTEIRLPASLTEIGDMAFAECRGLTAIEIPAQVTRIGEFAFGETANLRSFTVAQENTAFCDIDGVLFSKDTESLLAFPGSRQGTYQIPGSVKEIGAGAFGGCTGLTAVTIPEGVAAIGDQAFVGCTGLTAIELPEGLETVGSYAFLNCTALKSITVNDPETVLGSLSLGFYATSSFDPVPGAVIYGWHGSTAEAYAKNNGVTFRRFGSEIVVTGTDSVLAGRLVKVKAEDIQGGDPLTKLIWSSSRPDIVNLLPSRDTFSCTVVAQNVPELINVRIKAASITGEDVPGTFTLTIHPLATAMAVHEQTAGGSVDVTNAKKEVDMFRTGSIQLTAVGTQPTGAGCEVTWQSSSASLATVNADGVVTFLKPGTVTITATSKDKSTVRAKVTYVVSYYDKATRITGASNVPSIGLQFGDTAAITAKGTSEIPQNMLTMTVDSRYALMGSVKYDETAGRWVVRAGDKAGTLPVVVSLKDDPLKRKVTVNVKVIPQQVTALELHAEGVAAPSEIVDGVVVIDAAAVAAGAKTFVIRPSGTYSNGTPAVLNTKAKLSYSSSKTSVASVAAQADGTAIVTIKTKGEGVCRIQAKTTDLAKTPAALDVEVRSYVPVLSAEKVSLDSYNPNSVLLGVTEMHGNRITLAKVAVYEYNSKTKSYADTESQQLAAKYNSGDGTLALSCVGEKAMANGSYKVRLAFRTDRGIYTKDITVTVKNVLPKLTVKQTAKVNNFYTDAFGALQITAANAVVTGAKLADCSFALEQQGAADWKIVYDHSAESRTDTKGVLLITVEGYRFPVERSITISTVTAKPVLTLSTAKAVINTNPAWSTDYSCKVGVYNKTMGRDAELVTVGVNPATDVWAAAQRLSASEVKVTLKPQNTRTGIAYKGGTAVIRVQEANWSAPIEVRLSVAVNTGAPAMKLGATTVKVNRLAQNPSASVALTLTQANIALDPASVTFEGADNYTKDLMNGHLKMAYQNGQIRVELTGGADVPARTYYVWVNGKVGGQAMTRVKLAVRVTSA